MIERNSKPIRPDSLLVRGTVSNHENDPQSTNQYQYRETGTETERLRLVMEKVNCMDR